MPNYKPIGNMLPEDFVEIHKYFPEIVPTDIIKGYLLDLGVPSSDDKIWNIYQIIVEVWKDEEKMFSVQKALGWIEDDE